MENVYVIIVYWIFYYNKRKTSTDKMQKLTVNIHLTLLP